MKTVIPEHILKRIKWSELKRDERSDYPDPVGIIHEPHPCEDCGKTVTDRRIEIRVRESPYKHWAHTCAECGLHRDPESGKFEIEPKRYYTVLMQAARRRT